MINLVHERTPMPEQSKGLRCKNFDEVALGYTPLEAVGEAMRCLNCREKPCVAGCPIHQQIPEFLARVAEGDFDGAYDVITQRSSLPAVCGRVCPQEQQCEKNCAHVRKGEAVAIGRLERFVADWHDAHTPISAPEVEKKGKKVAVIGSGPAGIACAGDLAALGYEVTVFEKLAYAGGILTYGIPTFVLPRSVVDRALKTLWAQGVEIVTGAPVDGARTVDDLFAAGYQAVFVGNGADVPQVPPGLDTTLAGVWTANDYLTQVNLHSGELPESIRAAKRVLVVGGGNYWRGVKDGGGQMERSRADQMGMLATVMNSLALQDVLEQVGQPARVLTSIPMGPVGEILSRPAADRYLWAGEVVIFAGGTGNPYFSTDTAAVLRAAEIQADMILLAKNIDGVYSADPKKDPGAVKYDAISYDQVLADHLQVMDLTATSLAMENHIPVMIFALADPQNILRAVMGERIGTIVEEETKS